MPRLAGWMIVALSSLAAGFVTDDVQFNLHPNLQGGQTYCAVVS
jgi:hypothetical protein